MYTPKLDNTCSCGSGKKASNCGCVSRQSQYANAAIHSLPKPSVPADPFGNAADPSNTDANIWAGADVPSLGIVTGDPLTEVLSKIFVAIENGIGGGTGAPANLINNLDQVTANVGALDAAQGSILKTMIQGVVTLDQNAIIVNAALANLFKITITANRVLSAPLNGFDGQIIRFAITQGGAGGFTVSFAAGYRESATFPFAGFIQSVDPTKTDYIYFIKNGGNWDCLGYSSGH
jgi:hypothetical protein